MNPRQALLFVALVATLGASWWVTQREDEVDSAAVVQPAERVARASVALGARSGTGAEASASSRLERLSNTRAPWPDVPDVARIVSFDPPRPSRAPTAPAAPVAPPLPFRLVGAIDDEHGKAVFLLDGSQVRMVRAGEQIADDYRLDRITPAGVEFTYLPLNTKQTLSLRTP